MLILLKLFLESNIGLKDKLQKVSYSSRYAMGLFYKPGTVLDIPWKAKYFYDDPCIRFVALDNKKRGIGIKVFIIQKIRLNSIIFMEPTCDSL